LPDSRQTDLFGADPEVAEGRLHGRSQCGARFSSPSVYTTPALGHKGSLLYWQRARFGRRHSCRSARIALFGVNRTNTYHSRTGDSCRDRLVREETWRALHARAEWNLFAWEDLNPSGRRQSPLIEIIPTSRFCQTIMAGGSHSPSA